MPNEKGRTRETIKNTKKARKQMQTKLHKTDSKAEAFAIQESLTRRFGKIHYRKNR